MKQLLMDVMEYTYDVITAPKRTFNTIVTGMRLREGLLIWAFTLVLPCLSVVLQMRQGSFRMVAGTLLIGIVFYIVQIVCVHGMASILGGKGDIKALAAGIGFSDIPLNFATLAASLIFILPMPLVRFISFVSFVWSLVLTVLVVRASYGFSTARSIAALFLPILFLVCVCISIALYCVFSVMTLIKAF